jgi:hypothetical protein
VWVGADSPTHLIISSCLKSAVGWIGTERARPVKVNKLY